MFPPAAVSIPMTRPLASASGPPESPGLMSALVWNIPCRVSVSPELWSLATMVRPRLLITPGAAAERLTAMPGRATAYSVGIALFCVLGGILLALASNVPVSVYVTSLSFGCYLAARFLIGPRSIAREGQRRYVAERTVTEPPGL